MVVQCGFGIEGKAWDQRVHVDVGLDLSCIDIQFLAPHQFRLLALFDNGIEEATEDLQAIALADAGQT